MNNPNPNIHIEDKLKGQYCYNIEDNEKGLLFNSSDLEEERDVLKFLQSYLDETSDETKKSCLFLKLWTDRKIDTINLFLERE